MDKLKNFLIIGLLVVVVVLLVTRNMSMYAPSPAPAPAPGLASRTTAEMRPACATGSTQTEFGCQKDPKHFSPTTFSCPNGYTLDKYLPIGKKCVTNTPVAETVRPSGGKYCPTQYYKLDESKPTGQQCSGPFTQPEVYSCPRGSISAGDRLCRYGTAAPFTPKPSCPSGGFYDWTRDEGHKCVPFV